MLGNNYCNMNYCCRINKNQKLISLVETTWQNAQQAIKLTQSINSARTSHYAHVTQVSDYIANPFNCNKFTWSEKSNQNKRRPCLVNIWRANFRSDRFRVASSSSAGCCAVCSEKAALIVRDSSDGCVRYPAFHYRT